MTWYGPWLAVSTGACSLVAPMSYAAIGFRCDALSVNTYVYGLAYRFTLFIDAVFQGEPLRHLVTMVNRYISLVYVSIPLIEPVCQATASVWVSPSVACLSLALAWQLAYGHVVHALVCSSVSVLCCDSRRMDTVVYASTLSLVVVYCVTRISCVGRT